MPQILARDEENAKRKQRLAKQKKGAGVFVYDGTACDTESIPTYKTAGRNVPVYDAHGVPRTDSTGRPVYEREGAPVMDDKGRPMLGGVPRLTKIPIETWTIRGVAFPKGKPVEVSDPSLALKLRCLGCFKEIEGEDADADAVGALGKPAMIKLAAQLGVKVDQEMSQRAIAGLIQAKLDEPEEDLGDKYVAMSKAGLVAECDKRKIEIPDGASKAAIRDLLKGETSAG